MLAKTFLLRCAALASAAAGAYLLGRHPLSGVVLTLAFTAYLLVLWRRPHWWLYALLGALPVLNFYPWSGWLAIEEFDIAVLATLAVGYWRASPQAPAHRLGGGAAIVVAALSASYLASALLPLRDPAAIGWQSLGSYAMPVNGLRVLKGWLWPLLLLPLLRRAADAYGAELPAVLARGMLAGLFSVSAVVLWERNAFPGLINFSTDYRAIGPFFEAHVGGAALDGYLALALPFAFALAVQSRSPRSVALAAALLLLGAYASFATFSRGLYLGIGIAIALMGSVLLLRHGAAAGRGFRFVAIVVAGLVCALLLTQVFANGGYRTLAAVLGVFAGGLYVGGIGSRTDGTRSLGLLAVMSALTAVAVALVPKGAYVAYGASVLALGVAGYLERTGELRRSELVFAAWGWVALNALAVAWHWGGAEAVRDAALAVFVAIPFALYNRRAPMPLWSLSWPMAGAAVTGGLLLAIAVPVVGNYYMKTRLQTVDRDLQRRESHWQGSIAMRGTGWEKELFGAGLGSYPERYYWHNRKGEYPGAVVLMHEVGRDFVRLAQPRSAKGGSVEPLRFGQRVELDPGQTLHVRASVRSAAPKAILRFNVCEKWLLYTERCAPKGARFVPLPGEWSTQSAEIATAKLGTLHWWGKRTALVSMAVDGSGAVVDVADVALTDGAGNSLIANGTFAAGLDRWYFTSDHSHLPWHAKNLWLGVWFDQGWLGLASFLTFLALVLLRARLGGTPYDLALAAGLCAFLAVGVFDSLLDAPRLAVLFYLLGLAVLMQNGRPAPEPAPSPPSRRTQRHRASGRRSRH